MGRKTKEITITDEASRDNGRKYLITEMPASQCEKWALRVLSTLVKGGFDPSLVGDAGGDMEKLVRAGLETVLGKIDFYDMEPLLDEMMACVQAVSTAGIARKLVEEDIEEIKTRLALRREVFALHVDFFENAAP